MKYQFIDQYKHNRQRRHSFPGYLSPSAFEQQWELTAKNLAVFSPDEWLSKRSPWAFSSGTGK